MLARLDRIEALEREGARSGALLEEVRLLLGEAECWMRVEQGGTEAARDALDRCSTMLAQPAEIDERKSRTLVA